MRRIALAVSLFLLGGCDDDEQPTLIEVGDGPLDVARLIDAADTSVSADGPLTTPDEEVTDAAVAMDAVPDLPPDTGPTTACDNGADDDGDGAVDYPADPGCESPADDDEEDPQALACGDGADNDGDGRIDHPDDPGCASPRDPSEASACEGLPHEVIDASERGRFEGSTAGAPAVLDSCRTNRAPEALFRFTLRDDVERLHFDTAGSLFDTQLAIYRECPAEGIEPIACNDDATEDVRTSAVDIERPAMGDYIVVVDGFLEEAGGFVLTVRAELADGRPCEGAEAPLGCAPGRVCRGGTCAPAACSDGQDNDGDARVDFPNEPGCASPDDDDEVDPQPTPECADGLDNDGNGLSDYPNDEWCESAADDEERRPPQCRDGRDNDRDGFTDLADPGCEGDPERDNEFNVEACRDGMDNDEDGAVDYPNDPGCERPRDPDETDPNPPPSVATGSTTMRTGRPTTPTTSMDAPSPPTPPSPTPAWASSRWRSRGSRTPGETPTESPTSSARSAARSPGPRACWCGGWRRIDRSSGWS